MSIVAQPIHAGCPVTTAPPLFISVTPGHVLQGVVDKQITITGKYLNGAAVTAPGVTISSVISSDLEVGFKLTVPDNADVAPKTFTLTTSQGSFTFPINILSSMYPGGVFNVWCPVWLSLWDAAVWDANKWDAYSQYAWQTKKMYFWRTSAWLRPRIRRWDEETQVWLLIDDNY